VTWSKIHKCNKRAKKFKNTFFLTHRLFSLVSLLLLLPILIIISIHHHIIIMEALGSRRFVAERRRRRRGQNDDKTLARAFETHRGFGKSREKGRFGDEFSSLGKVFFFSQKKTRMKMRILP